MDPLPVTSWQGMLVRVFDDCIAFTRRDFSIDRMLGGDWVMPLPAAKSKVFAFETRRAKEKPPAFAADAMWDAGSVKEIWRGYVRHVGAAEGGTGTLFSAGLIAGEGLCGIILALLSLI